MKPRSDRPLASRRGLFAAAGGLMATGFAAAAPDRASASNALPATEPFWGAHQGGIITPMQSHTYFAAFDLTTERRQAVIDLLRTWTNAAARLTSGRKPAPLAGQPTPQPLGGMVAPAPGDMATPADFTPPPPAMDSEIAEGLPPSRLTVTFGFGAGLFQKNGRDRYGLAAHRPAALIDLPSFNGDQLVAETCGGDLSVQACADDPQVAFHAVRHLANLAYGTAELRWAQTGYCARPADGSTPRNLMGFKDGTQTPADRDKVVWVGPEGPDWMQGGSYLVVRRIRMALEHWDRTAVSFQERTMGRQKHSGAPIGLKGEFEPLGLDRTDGDGNKVIAEAAHVRLANVATTGAEILRRGYSYNDGVNFTAERWPPWRQGMEYDAGLLFICYQADPRTGFVRMFEPMAKLDMLNQFTTHTGSALFACPGGVREGEFIGQSLFAGV
ncbi:MAG TPA: Dyp-type peroxidase [Rhodopila sp.]|nr:Dyp-type peroxidase [Rhodopila sp.]